MTGDQLCHRFSPFTFVGAHLSFGPIMAPMHLLGVAVFDFSVSEQVCVDEVGDDA